MWLVNTRTIELRSFSEAFPPPYAILSHTWGSDNDEVSFQEMSSAAAARPESVLAKPGYHKILKTCQLAKEKGYDWAWVDTCCIDKSSSAELSEAINSMYRWYARSKECFVFLCDFMYVKPWSGSDPLTVRHFQLLRHCRW
jgi:hypothetical protein